MDKNDIVKHFVTNTEKPVFGFRNLPPEVVGALFARYSRSELGARELLAEEFLSGDAGDVGAAGEEAAYDRVDKERADKFFAKVLEQFGDDSVAELAHTALAVEGVSNVLVKIIEDRRIGISPLEKSSRYVRFDRRDEQGRFPYFRDFGKEHADLQKPYEEAMDNLFVTYSELIGPVMEHLKKRFPQKEGTSEKAYAAALKAQACDVVRYLLPMGTKTNVGLVGNGRAFEYLLYKLRSCGLREGEQYAEMMYAELKKMIHVFVRRSESERGSAYVGHFENMKNDIEKKAADILNAQSAADKKMAPASDAAENESSVRLLHFDKYGEAKIAAGLLFEYGEEGYDTYVSLFKNNRKSAEEIIAASLAARRHRTHRPPRAFEHAYYTFEVVCDIGAFRDIHRHRILTQQRQPYGTNLGYVVPQDIKDAGLEERYRSAMEKAASAHTLFMDRGACLEAQYAVPFGFLVRVLITLNAREAYHFCELRSSIQGHPSYRFIAQEMAKKITKVHPAIGSPMMVTWDGYDELARVRAEQRREIKRREKKEMLY